MKTNFFPLLLLMCVAVFSFSACGDDDDNFEETLNYDGPNFTAPQNEAGLNVFATYFPNDVLQDFSGRRLQTVRFWLTAIPAQTSVVVYGFSGNDAVPGDELYRIDISQRVSNTGWVDHVIPGGLDIPANGLWLAVETDIASNGLQSVGCDEGRSYNPNGDRLLWPSSGGWNNFNTLTNGAESVNWNIRGILAAE